MLAKTKSIKVFYSYSHKDKVLRDRLEVYLATLRNEGVIREWHDRCIKAGQDWRQQIDQHLAAAELVLLLISADFIASEYCYGIEMDQAMEQHESGKTRVIPIILKPTDWQSSRFSKLQCLPTDGKPVMGKGWSSRAEAFLDIAKGIRKVVKEMCSTALPDVPDGEQQKVDVSRMPRPQVGMKLVGRTEQFDELRKTYEDPNIAIVAVIGNGGVGKSFLANAFLKEREKQGYDAAQRVYAWSFYDQKKPTSDTDQKEPTYTASSASFFVEALPFFGHRGELPNSEKGKAELLVKLLRKRKSLLVLDGVETLQFQPEVEQGRFSDQAMGDLLRDLGRTGLHNGGRVLITSRQSLVELEEYEGETYHEIKLEALGPEEGAQLLRKLGVNGTDKELLEASDGMGGHPLALILLGKMLKEYFNGRISDRFLLPPLLTEAESGGHAKRVMQWYDERWKERGAPERTLLQFLGLFDRPMEGRELGELLDKLGSGIAKPLFSLTEGEWNHMVRVIRRVGLLASDNEVGPTRWNDFAKWDTHPLVREYFGEQLRNLDLSGWRQAHQVLFEYFQDKVPNGENPTNSKGLEPLYDAVRHGCQAGKYKEAYEIYRYRVARDYKGFDTEELGLTMQALVAVSCFFPKPDLEGSPCEELFKEDQAWLLARGAYCLESAGRLGKAEDLRKKSNALYQMLKKWHETATGAEELAVLQTRLGKFKQAKDTADKAVYWADRAAEKIEQEALGPTDAAKMNEKLEKAKTRQFATRAALATVLYRQGELKKAHACFQEAEEIHKKVGEEIHKKVEEEIHKKVEPLLLLHSIPGVRYCALLLDIAKNKEQREEVLERAEEILKKYYKYYGSERFYPLMDAMHHLNKGRILTELGRWDEVGWDEVGKELKCALDKIRENHKIQFECQPLLARATFWYLTKKLNKARTDLQEVLKISRECQMRLYEVDAQLLLGHVELDDTHELTGARVAFREAEKRIERHQYGLRFAELYLLDARLLSFEGHADEARKKLEDARVRFEKIGYERLRQQWERIRNELDS